MFQRSERDFPTTKRTMKIESILLILASVSTLYGSAAAVSCGDEPCDPSCTNPCAQWHQQNPGKQTECLAETNTAGSAVCDYTSSGRKCQLKAAFGTSECGEVAEGGDCKMKWNDNADKFQPVPQKAYKCSHGFTCVIGDAQDADSEVPGTCESDTCYGNNGEKDVDSSTDRVTICHRTCSEKNPWVRITVDDDSWNGTMASGCGHQNHEVDVECQNKATGPGDAWGLNRGDYLLRWHGKKDQPQIDYDLTDNELKDYWKYWERACPYVRGTGCCSNDSTDPVYGLSCCGYDAATDSPTSSPTETPTAKPSPAPSSSPAPTECVDADNMATAVLVTEDSGTVMPNPPCLEIMSSSPTDKTITFKVSQCWMGDDPCTENMDWLNVNYKDVNDETQCTKFNNMCKGDSQIFTTPCDGDDVSYVTLYAYDPYFSASNTPPAAGCLGWPSVGVDGGSTCGDSYLSGGSGAASADGNLSEWSNDDLLADMHEAGKTSKELAAKAYSKYDCSTQTLCVMVQAQSGYYLDDEFWLKIYDDGNGGGSTSAMTPIGGGIATVTGSGGFTAWEGCYSVGTGCIDSLEIHANFGAVGGSAGRTASTGKRSTQTINLGLDCADTPGTPALTSVASYTYMLTCSSECDHPSSSPTGSPNASPTAGPTAGSTAAPNASPTAGPTKVPSDAPSSVPTGSPTAGPTAGPADSPSLAPIPSNECPEDVELIAVVGGTQYPQVPIVVTSQTREKVTFKVHNTYVEELNELYVQYHANDKGKYSCEGASPVARGEFQEYTAYCMHNCPITIVEVWGKDDSIFTPGVDNAKVPKCCTEFSDHSQPAVQYTFKIHCESQCPEDNYRRELETDKRQAAGTREQFVAVTREDEGGDDFQRDIDGDGNFGSEKDGHFCSALDYPCGDDNDMVHVCHHSTRFGYQTFCVPEPDSDVVGLYAKDYCGPCIEGYKPTLRGSSSSSSAKEL